MFPAWRKHHLSGTAKLHTFSARRLPHPSDGEGALATYGLTGHPLRGGSHTPLWPPTGHRLHHTGRGRTPSPLGATLWPKGLWPPLRVRLYLAKGGADLSPLTGLREPHTRPHWPPTGQKRAPSLATPLGEAPLHGQKGATPPTGHLLATYWPKGYGLRLPRLAREGGRPPLGEPRPHRPPTGHWLHHTGSGGHP